MIIIDSQYFQNTVPLTLCVMEGEVMTTAYIIGPSFIKSAFLPELDIEGNWVLSVTGIKSIDTLKINNKLYFESENINLLSPGQFILNVDSQQLTIKPYDS